MLLRRLLVVLLMLWLPIQTASAVIMPFCAHALGAQVPQLESATSAEAHCALHDALDGSSALHDDANCDQCALCHLACAGFMPVSLVPTGSAAASSVATGRLLHLHSVIPDLDVRPPIAVSC